MIGIILAGQIEKGQEEITKCMLLSLHYVIEDSIILTTMERKLSRMICIETNKIPKLEDWSIFKKDVENFIEEKCISAIIVVKPSMLFGYRKNNQNAYNSIIKNFENGILVGNKNLTYVTTKAILNRFMFIHIASRKIKIVHYCFDPNEIIFKNEIRVGLLNDDITCYIPCYESLLISMNNRRAKEKELDFAFYCSAMTDERKYMHDLKEYLENDENFKIKTDIKIITKDEKKSEIKQDDYYKILSKVKYTLIIPSYDINSFSIIRFIEAISCDCLPLVYSKCNINALSNDFDEIRKIIKKYLLVDDIRKFEDKIKSLEKSRDYFLKLIKETNDWKKIKSKKYLKQKWEELLNV